MLSSLKIHLVKNSLVLRLQGWQSLYKLFCDCHQKIGLIFFPKLAPDSFPVFLDSSGFFIFLTISIFYLKIKVLNLKLDWNLLLYAMSFWWSMLYDFFCFHIHFLTDFTTRKTIKSPAPFSSDLYFLFLPEFSLSIFSLILPYVSFLSNSLLPCFPKFTHLCLVLSSSFPDYLFLESMVISCSPESLPAMLLHICPWYCCTFINGYWLYNQ